MSSHSIKIIFGALCWEKALAVLIRADKIKHSFFMVLFDFYSIKCYAKYAIVRFLQGILLQS